ncbi:hypothetical protein FRC04_003996 [Tulasnella sp. 424]|nr:hypothetical protein FRC04_003996 [Tulasnella sp. 424]KAG8970592.1 hypothetical protein FRC05_000528 [Tulasnella sp. 425]
MLPNHPNGYPPGGSNNNPNWQNNGQAPHPYYSAAPANGHPTTSDALTIRGPEDYVLTADEERQLLRTKQMVEDMLARSRHNKERAELEARLSGQMDLVATTSSGLGAGVPLTMQGPPQGSQQHQAHGMYPSNFTPVNPHPLEPLGSVRHAPAQIVEVPNTPTDQGSLQPQQIQNQQWQYYLQAQQQRSQRPGDRRGPPDTLGGLYPLGNRAQEQQPSASVQHNAQPISRPAASSSLPQSYQNFAGPSARLGLRPPSFPTTYQSTAQQSQSTGSYPSGSSDAPASSTRALESSSSSGRAGLPFSNGSTRTPGAGPVVIPNVVAAASGSAAPPTATRRGSGPAPNHSSSSAKNVQQPNLPTTIHVDVRSKLPPAPGRALGSTSSKSLSTPLPSAAPSTSTVPRSHAEALQNAPIRRLTENGSATSTPSPPMPLSSISPAPGPDRLPSGKQLQSTTTLQQEPTRSAAAGQTANESTPVPPAQTVQPSGAAPPAPVPVRAAPDAPVYTYFMPFGPTDSAPILYQVTQAQLDTQFSLAWEEILKNGGKLTPDQHKSLLQNLQFVYKHICQTGLRRDNQYHFLIQSGVPRPPMPTAIPNATQAPTNEQPRPENVPSGDSINKPGYRQTATPHPSASSSAAIPPAAGSGNARPQPDQEPVSNRAGPSKPNQNRVQLGSVPASSAGDRPLPPPSSTAQTLQPTASAPTPLQANPSTPKQTTSFVEILRQNNPSPQDLANSIIRALGSPRKNTRKRKFDTGSDVEIGQSSDEKGKQRPKLGPEPKHAKGNPSAGPPKGDSGLKASENIPMASAPGSGPLPLETQAIPTPTPVQAVFGPNPYLPAPTAPAKTSPGGAPVPKEALGPAPTATVVEPSATEAPIAAPLNAPASISAAESDGSGMVPTTPQRAAPPEPSQEASPKLPRMQQPEFGPPVQSTLPADRSPSSPQPPKQNTPNIIPPTPTQPAAVANPLNLKHLIPPSVHPYPPSRGRAHKITPPPTIAVLPASDDTHFSPPLEPASGGGDSEVDELMDDADENPKALDVVVPDPTPTTAQKPPLPINEKAIETTEAAASSPRVRVRPRTEFWVEIPYRPDLLKKARKGPPVGPRLKDPPGGSSSRIASRSASASVEGRPSRTPSQAGTQPNDCTALLDTENSLLKHVHGTHRSVGELCTIALPTQLMPLTELPTFPPEPVPVYHEYKKLVRPAVISKAKREKLTPEVLRKVLGHGMSQGLPRNLPLRRLLRVALTLETASAFDEYEFLRKEDDKDLRPMRDLTDLRGLKEEMTRTAVVPFPGQPQSSSLHSVTDSNPPSRNSGQRSPLLPLNGLEALDGAETKLRGPSRRSSTGSSVRGSILDPIILDDLDN